MKNYQVTARRTRLITGIIRLSQEQADSRAHALKSLGGGLYEIMQPIEFKFGESFGYEGQTKAMEQTIVPVAADIPEPALDQVKRRGRKKTVEDGNEFA